MKFCKNLQRVVDISDPEWAPYWTNYKMLKKLIKELPSLVPAEEVGKTGSSAASLKLSESPESKQKGCTASSKSAAAVAAAAAAASGAAAVDSVRQQQRQQHGDKTAETTKPSASTATKTTGGDCSADGGATSEQQQKLPTTDATTTAANSASGSTMNDSHVHSKEELGKSPGEIAFFKLLHAEFKKATHFFDKAQLEFSIREERVREGMEIMKRPNSIMVNEKWSMLAKSIYRLYKDLLLLETFAIMTYCSFSKILKKHDKVTGYQTRSAFMANVVNRANFTNYPKVLEMISRCERLYEDVSTRLLQEGKQGLYEDERLFINMISRLNEQALDSADAPDRREARALSKNTGSATSRVSFMHPPAQAAPGGGGDGGDGQRVQNSQQQAQSKAVSALRSLVEENDAAKAAAQVSEGQGGDGSDDEVGDNESPSGVSRKRTVAASSQETAAVAMAEAAAVASMLESAKRQRLA